MRRRLFNWVAGSSMLLFVLTIAVWVRSMGDGIDFHKITSRSDSDQTVYMMQVTAHQGRMTFAWGEQQTDSPTTNGWQLGGADRRVSIPRERVNQLGPWGSRLGIFFVKFDPLSAPAAQDRSIFSLPLLLPAIATAALPILWMVRRGLFSEQKIPVCAVCNERLTDLTRPTCARCGTRYRAE